MAMEFKCPRCDRAFSMAAHLARHMNTIHAGKGRKKTATNGRAKAKRRVGRPKLGKKRVGRPKGSVSARRGAAGAGAVQLLSRLQSYERDLVAQRDSLDAQVGAVQEAIAALGG